MDENIPTKNSGSRGVIYALLLLLPTYVGAPVQLYLLFAGVVLFLERARVWDFWQNFKKAPFQKSNRLVWLVGLILLVSLINKMVNGHHIYSLRDYYAPFYLFPILIAASALAFSQRFFKALILIIAFESLFGFAEYAAGMRSFFIDLGDSGVIRDYATLYNSRVYGLSANSSILAQKLLIAFILIDFVRFSKFWEWTLRVVLLLALLITFSRIAIIVLLAYWMISFLIGVMHSKVTAWKSPNLLFKALLLISALVFISPLKNQLTRDGHDAESAFEAEDESSSKRILENTNALKLSKGESDPNKQGLGDKLMKSAEGIQSSGRKLIWLNYINYIEKKPLFGNGSDKLMFYKYSVAKQKFKMIHAHNSFLQLIASNGIIIAALYFLFYILLFRSRNFVAIGAILIYCLGNYGIFYGFSSMDVIFLILLIYPLTANYDHARES